MQHASEREPAGHSRPLHWPQMNVTPSYLVVDAGTSRTRVRLWHAGSVVDELEARVGAKDVALAGSSQPIAEGLRALITMMRERHDHDAMAVVCSGMITSNVGLVEVPHATAPIALGELARRLVRHDVASVTDLPMYFVPGIKTVATGEGWETLANFDVMRGEEVEVVGLLQTLDLEPPLAFFHCGSHHKLIEVGAADTASANGDANGVDGAVVLRSSTAITGELLAAIRERTILASSLTDLDGIELDPEAVAAGARHARAAGFARAAFLVRVGETIAGKDRMGVTSFLLGALADLDLQLIEHELAADREVVVYGGGLFPAIVRDMLTRAGDRRVRLVDPRVSDAAATIGTVRSLETFLGSRAGAPA